jgi:hypothetical protein
MPVDLDKFARIVIADVITPAGLTATRDGTGLLISGSDGRSARLELTRFAGRLDQGEPLADVVSLSRRTLAAVNAQGRPTTADRATLWPHVSTDKPGVLTRPLFGPLTEVLALNQPDNWVFVSARVLAELGWDTETAWREAVAHRAAAVPAPTEAFPLPTTGHLVRIWHDVADAADAAWAVATNAVQPMLAILAAEELAAVVEDPTDFEIAAVLAASLHWSLNPHWRLLLPGVGLFVLQGTVTRALQVSGSVSA